MPLALPSQCLAMRVRIGFQKSLLTLLLENLCMRFQAIQQQAGETASARLVAVFRTSAVTVDELHLLLEMPAHTFVQARAWLIQWGECQIDLLNDAYPYGAGALMQSHGQEPASYAFVQCDVVDPVQWLRRYDAPADVVLALSSAVPAADLKTTLPVAIWANIAVSGGGSLLTNSANLFAVVFSETQSTASIRAMLEHCLQLHRNKRIVMRENLQLEHVALVALLEKALHNARQVAIDDSIANARVLLNQLGFSATESDYLILLSLPMLRLQGLLHYAATLEERHEI
jgi:hypothetical protein